MSKIRISLGDPVHESTSALTEVNVKDLRAIHLRMTELTTRAENIIASAHEVFPAAKASWLRKLKSALGMLQAKDGATLEDTIEFCERLVSESSAKNEA